MAWINNTNMSAGEARRWGNDGNSSMRKKNHKREMESKGRDADNRKRIEKLETQVKQQKKAPAPQKKAPPKPKPGPQQIEPVKHSPEMTAAQKVAADYQAGLKNTKSPWEQAQSDAASSANVGQFNPGGNSAPSNQPQQDPQQFADKYKLNLINTGATKSNNEGNESSMSGSDILKRDKEQGWS